MPCHEFCGCGHQSMWAEVKAVDKATFLSRRDNQAEAELC